ncbi:hypothetical protein BKA62DRAFT_681286 [Auriculariales sp. MPI-PUGE-AT-0066]|nr:hypothetical protein BKA62DRAFT_681286 [Auriculariales sp. MPI-PUGE-AT-0066]
MQWEPTHDSSSASSTHSTQQQHQQQHQPSQQPAFESADDELHSMFRPTPHHHSNGQHASQPPSPPSFQDPFVRQPANAPQRRSSKQLQRAPIPPHQQSTSPPNGTSSSNYYPDSHASHPQQPAAAPANAPSNPGQPRHSLNTHANRASVSYDRADPAHPQGRLASPSAQPNYLPQTASGSYSRRPSYAGPASSADSPYPMPSHRPSIANSQSSGDRDRDREPVTIFMEDYRGAADGEPEHLLAEVTISLRASQHNDGFWANAQELVNELQNGPSRIDGPARVFCRRGKYKHCFLRLSETSQVECVPSSLQISPEMSIQVMIESNKHSQHRSGGPYIIPARGTAGRIASPRASTQYDLPAGQGLVHGRDSDAYHPQHYSSATSPQLRHVSHAIAADVRRGSAPVPINSPPLHRKRSIPDSSPTAMVVDIDDRPTKRPSISNLSQGGGSGYASSQYVSAKPPSYGPRPSTGGGPLPPQAGPSSYDPYPSPPGGYGDNGRERTPTQSLSNPNSINDLKGASSTAKEHSPPPGSRGFDDGQWRAPRAQVNTAIANWLKPQIQREDGYAEFMHSKGHVLTVPQLLRVYGFAQRQIQKWNNQRTPDNADGCPLKKIGKSNVLQALGRQTSWGSDCEQTLAFVEKYGPGGPREMERVVALVHGKVMPGEKEGSVYFLSVLRDVDREWRAANETRQHTGAQSGGESMDEDQRRSSLESGSATSQNGGEPSAHSPQQHFGHQHAG